MLQYQINWKKFKITPWYVRINDNEYPVRLHFAGWGPLQIKWTTTAAKPSKDIIWF